MSEQTRADLRGADLSGANLTGADLSEADLRGADLSGANLTGADLSWADLRGADLTGADLRWADLSRADLSGVNLSNADLSGANLTGADLSEADLRGADLTGADLSGADLSGVTLHLDQIGVALLTSDMVEQLIARLGYVKGEASAPCPQWLHECLTPFVLDKIEELLRRSFDEDCTREQTANHLNSLALAWRLTLDGDLAKAFDHIEDVTVDLP